MAPRTHNTTSYAVAALVFAGLVPWSDPGAAFVAGLWIFHFARRALESLFVHRYSGRKVPASDYLMEYAYYWGFAGWIAWSLRQGIWTLPSRGVITAAILVFSFGELGNAWAHQKLRKLRESSGQTHRNIPRGGPFEWVSCPHYLFEIISWAGFSLLVQTLPALTFLCLGGIIVSSYASSRHRAYRQHFDGREGKPLYPQRRRAIFPGIF